MIKKFFIILILAYVLLALGLYFFQEKIIFRGKKLAKDFVYQFDYKFTEVNFEAEDKSIINALHFTVEKPKGVILYFHGNKGSLARWGDIVAPYTEYGYDVFVIDYRGYGKHNGKRSEDSLYADALKSYSYLKQRFSEDQIIVYGRSLGGTFATRVASEHQPKHLILEAPFYNILDFSRRKFALLPYKLLLRYKFESNRYMKSVNCPITIFHGDNDALIPLASGQKLFDVASNKNAEIVIIPNGTHHNLTTFDLYKQKVKTIFH